MPRCWEPEGRAHSAWRDGPGKQHRRLLDLSMPSETRLKVAAVRFPRQQASELLGKFNFSLISESNQSMFQGPGSEHSAAEGARWPPILPALEPQPLSAQV